LFGAKNLNHDGTIDKESIEKFVSSEGHPTLADLDQNVWKRSVMQKKSLLVGFIKPTETEHKDLLQKLADEYKGKFVSSWMDGPTNEGLVSRWGGSGKVFPTSIFVHFTEGASDPKFYIWNEETEKDFTYDTVKSFIESSLAGTYTSYKKSEPIPESNDGPVKVVVGKQFEEIVFDNTKDVLVEFYAPWCGHCKKLAPIYDELGKAFESEQGIVIAKIDATANSYPETITIRGSQLFYFSLQIINKPQFLLKEIEN